MTRTRLLAAAAALALFAAACGGGDKEIDATPTSGRQSQGIAAVVASYDLAVNQPRRFIVGVLRDDQQQVVAFGTVQMGFAFLGTKEQPASQAKFLFTSQARFLPIPGQNLDLNTPGPRLGSGSEGTGVYASYNVKFDKPGLWGVQVVAKIGGKSRRANANFEVAEAPSVPSPGQAAPRTKNPIASSTGVDPSAIDSRADETKPVPDTDLHDTVIADAIAARRPLMVVVSTPTYCVSRFCGPITDGIEALAKLQGDKVDFVHLEVWQDFEKKALNPAAAEWISPGGGDANEPWIFTVKSDGTIGERFDNVVTEGELLAAIQALST